MFEVPLILYHYCSQESFLSIAETSSFRCSALSLSNDSMEGKWAHKVFSDICDGHKLDASHKERVLNVISGLNNIYEALGFCLSEDGDMLSQWRGYALNGTGFSIGLSKENLEDLATSLREKKSHAFNLEKVNYDINKQRIELAPAYEKIKAKIEEGAFRTPSLLTMATTEKGKLEESEKLKKLLSTMNFEILTEFFPKLFSHKNPAFKEELEWRITSPFIKSLSDNNIKYRSAGDRLIPFITFHFRPENEIIKEVVLGPKNRTPIDIVKTALEQFGHKNVSVKQSDATYR